MDVDGSDAKAGTENTLEAVVKYYDSEELKGVMDKIERFSAKQVFFDTHQYWLHIVFVNNNYPSDKEKPSMSAEQLLLEELILNYKLWTKNHFPSQLNKL